MKLGSFTTVEGFWKHFAYLTNPDNIPKDYTLFLSRGDVTPAWESYPNGGMWVIRVTKKNMLVDRLWEEICFAAIGELFANKDLVCVALSTRLREDAIAVWNRDNLSNPQARFEMSSKLKTILNLDEATTVGYKAFKDAIKDGSSYRNTVPYVYAVQTAAGPALPPFFPTNAGPWVGGGVPPTAYGGSGGRNTFFGVSAPKFTSAPSHKNAITGPSGNKTDSTTKDKDKSAEKTSETSTADNVAMSASTSSSA